MKKKKRMLRSFLLTFCLFLVFLAAGVMSQRKKEGAVQMPAPAVPSVSENVTSTQVPEEYPAAEPEEELPPETPEQTQEKEIIITFMGDILFSDGVLNNYDKNGLDGILSPQLQKTLNEAHLNVANEEFPFSNRGKAAPDKQYTFRIAPERAVILKQMGIDVVTLANNHTLDYGRDALTDTFAALDDYEITYMGAGINLERAKQIQYKSINGITVGLLGASRVIPVPDWNASADTPGLLTTYDPAILLEQIKEAKQNADLVIVYVHWGIEREEYPKEYQRTLAKMYIDAGADLVVGSHPHCLQGLEYYKGKPIVYSLGNFIFGTTIPQTAILKAVVGETGDINISILPCTANQFYTEAITDSGQIARFYDYLENISFQISIDSEGNVNPM